MPLLPRFGELLAVDDPGIGPVGVLRILGPMPGVIVVGHFPDRILAAQPDGMGLVNPCRLALTVGELVDDCWRVANEDHVPLPRNNHRLDLPLAWIFRSPAVTSTYGRRLG